MSGPSLRSTLKLQFEDLDIDHLNIPIPRVTSKYSRLGSDMPRGFEQAGVPEEQIFIQKKEQIRTQNERASLDPISRTLAIAMTASMVGVIIGGQREWQRAALRFRAEHAHRMPTSQKDWFFFQRAKSNYAMAAAMATAPKLGLKLAAATVGLVVMEEAIDNVRGNKSKDLFSSVGASLSAAGVFSLWRE